MAWACPMLASPTRHWHSHYKGNRSEVSNTQNTPLSVSRLHIIQWPLSAASSFAAVLCFSILWQLPPLPPPFTEASTAAAAPSTRRRQTEWGTCRGSHRWNSDTTLVMWSCILTHRRHCSTGSSKLKKHRHRSLSCFGSMEVCTYNLWL